MEVQLSKEERKELKKQNKHARLLAVILFIGISLVNLAFFYQDVLLGNEALDRPPLSQLILIETAALLVGLMTYYFPSRGVLKDLSRNIKQVEEKKVLSKFIMNENGKLQYTLRLSNAMNVAIDKSLFKSLREGDTVRIEFAATSNYIFNTHKDD